MEKEVNYTAREIIDNPNYNHIISGIDYRNDGSTSVKIGATAKDYAKLVNLGDLKRAILEETGLSLESMGNPRPEMYAARTAHVYVCNEDEERTLMMGHALAFNDRDKFGRLWPMVYAVVGPQDDEFLRSYIDPELMVEVLKQSPLTYEFTSCAYLSNKEKIAAVKLDPEFRKDEINKTAFVSISQFNPKQIALQEAPQPQRKSLLQRIFS